MTAVARLMLAAVATLMSTPTVGEDELTDCWCFAPDRCIVDERCSVYNKPRSRCKGKSSFRRAVFRCVNRCRELGNHCSCRCTTDADSDCRQSRHKVCVGRVFTDRSTVSHSAEVVSTTSVSTAAVSSPSNTVGLAVGLSIAALVLLALIVAIIVFYRHRCKLSALVQRAPVLGCLQAPTSAEDDSTKYETAVTPASAPTYEEIITPIGRTSGNSGTVKSSNQYQLETEVSAAPPASSASAASVPVITDAIDDSSLYKDTTTTLVDNALYDVQQPPVTSSNVDETGGDVNDLTVIDNDLYERHDQS